MVEENLIKRLMTSIKCGVCGRRYGESGIKVLGHQQDLWFLSASCKACQTRCLVAVVVKKEGLPEVVTDLTEAELSKLGEIIGPTGDNILDMHNFLKDFDGDFSRLFSREPDSQQKPPAT